jgi:hypothetical protein
MNKQVMYCILSFRFCFYLPTDGNLGLTDFRREEEKKTRKKRVKAGMIISSDEQENLTL